VPRFGTTRRRDLIRYLQQLGFQGPFSGAKHQFMVRANLRLRIPNPHQEDIGRNLLAEILRQAGISRDDWERLWGWSRSACRYTQMSQPRGNRSSLSRRCRLVPNQDA
jgi:predicted RNA binding protein YcfA (HicA-like mRNA interferase family)